MANSDETGVLIYAHGGGESWKQPVVELTGAIADELGVPTELAFELWPGERTLDNALASLTEQCERVHTLPLLTSCHSGVYRSLQDSLEDRLSETDYALGPTLLESGLLPEIYTRRYRDKAGDGRGALLVAHGPRSDEDALGWMKELRELAGEINDLTGAVHVSAGLARDDSPEPVKQEAEANLRELAELLHKAGDAPPLVFPVSVSDGRFNSNTVPEIFAGMEVVCSTRSVFPDEQAESEIVELVGKRLEVLGGPINS